MQSRKRWALGLGAAVVLSGLGLYAERARRWRKASEEFVTNHLGHFLLTHRLLDLVKAAPQGRIAVLSSQVLGGSHPDGIEWDNLSGERDYNPTSCYVATASVLENVSGCFVKDCNPVVPDTRACDLGASERLWTTSARMLRAYLS